MENIDENQIIGCDSACDRGEFISVLKPGNSFSIRHSKKNLVSLEEHNSKFYPLRPVSMGNGIACPICEEELSDQPEVLTSNPPQRVVSCVCGFRGSRY